MYLYERDGIFEHIWPLFGNQPLILLEYSLVHLLEKNLEGENFWALLLTLRGEDVPHSIMILWSVVLPNAFVFGMSRSLCPCICTHWRESGLVPSKMAKWCVFVCQHPFPAAPVSLGCSFSGNFSTSSRVAKERLGWNTKQKMAKRFNPGFTARSAGSKEKEKEARRIMTLGSVELGTWTAPSGRVPGSVWVGTVHECTPAEEEERDLTVIPCPLQGPRAAEDFLGCCTLSPCTLAFWTLVEQDVAWGTLKKCPLKYLVCTHWMHSVHVAPLLRYSRAWAKRWECKRSRHPPHPLVWVEKFLGVSTTSPLPLPLCQVPGEPWHRGKGQVTKPVAAS